MERELLALGAAVVRLGDPPRGSAPPAGTACLELNLDATDPAALDAGLEAAARRFGGLDAVVAPAAALDNPPEVLLDSASLLLRLAPAQARAAIRSLLVARAGVALWTLKGKNVRPGPLSDDPAQAAERLR